MNDNFPMKTIDMSNKTSAKAYLTKSPEKTHSKEELERVHNAIQFTKMFKQAESLAKMDDESPIEMPLPSAR
jgi:hypothetical protein